MIVRMFVTKLSRVDVEFVIRESRFVLYHFLLDKKLRLGRLFPMVKLNFVFTMCVAVTRFSQLYVDSWGFCRRRVYIIPLVKKH